MGNWSAYRTREQTNNPTNKQANRLKTKHLSSKLKDRHSLRQPTLLIPATQHLSPTYLGRPFSPFCLLLVQPVGDETIADCPLRFDVSVLHASGVGLYSWSVTWMACGIAVAFKISQKNWVWVKLQFASCAFCKTDNTKSVEIWNIDFMILVNKGNNFSFLNLILQSLSIYPLVKIEKEYSSHASTMKFMG